MSTKIICRFLTKAKMELIERYRDTSPLGAPGDHPFHCFGAKQDFSLKEGTRERFWVDYCTAVAGIEGPSTNLTLGETLPRESCPLVVDIKLTFDTFAEDADPIDLTVFAKEVVSYIQEAIISKFFIDPLSENNILTCAYLSADEFVRELKNGEEVDALYMRLHFPWCQIPKGDYVESIRKEVVKNMRQFNTASLLGHQPYGDWETCVTSSSTLPLSLYGSFSSAFDDKTRISTDNPFLTLNSLWSYPAKKSPYIPLEDVFDPTASSLVARGLLCGTTISEYDVPFLLPLFLSVTFCSVVRQPRREIVKNAFETDFSTPASLGRSGTIRGTNVEAIAFNKHSFEYKERKESYIIAETMLRLIRPEMFQNYSVWIEIGQALKNLAEDEVDKPDETPPSLLLWISFSIKAFSVVGIPTFISSGPNAIVTDCTNYYYSFPQTFITYKTLAWYARDNSPREYENWHDDWTSASLEKALSCEDSDIAEALGKVYWLDWTVYVTNTTEIWYNFSSGLWRDDPKTVKFRKIISKDFRDRYSRFRIVLSNKILEYKTEKERATGELVLKSIGRLMSKLNNTPSLGSIIVACKSYFYDLGLSQKLDSNPKLTSTSNGVLEVTPYNVIFRKGKPEDFLSVGSLVPFRQDFTWDTPQVVELMTWFGQVFPDQELCRHFCKISASMLRAGNVNKMFLALCGPTGDNSKSMVEKLFCATLRCVRVPVAVFTEKVANSASASPHLARTKGAKGAFFDEPEDNTPLNKGVIKRMTGCDPFFARFLHDNGGEITISFVVFFVCNNVPAIHNPDKAIKKRLKVLPFLSEWVEFPPDTEEERYRQRKFKMDPNFGVRIPFLAPAFLWVMVQFYVPYLKEGLVDPQIVKDYTQSYWNETDIYALFIRESISDTGDIENKITLQRAYDSFKKWHMSYYPGGKTPIPDKSDFKSQMNTKWGAMRDGYWYGKVILDGSV